MKTLKESLYKSLNESRINFKRVSDDLFKGKVSAEELFELYTDEYLEEGLTAEEFLESFANWLEDNGAEEVTANDVIENEREELLRLAFDAAIIDEY